MVVELIHAARGERDAVMDFEPLGSAAADAYGVAGSHLVSQLAPID